jgi:CDP-6-deoxy-D-xylo-4-hexulose-3-dehydrase
MSDNFWLGKVDKYSSGQDAIKLVKSSFYNEAKTKRALAKFILGTDRLSMGEQCLQFEQSFAKKQGREFAVFVSSGSMANLLLVQALINLGRLKLGDKIGFSALTWSTNVMPLIQLGLVPVPLDCNPDTLNVSPEILEKKAGELKGLFLTNVLGFCDDIEKIKAICESNDIVFFEDNCESLGSKVGETLLGNFGQASTFSFFVGHHMSTVEGGMICTDDAELYKALTMGRAHGWDRNLNPEDQKKLRDQHGVNEFYSRYTFYDLAYNARPSEINGFLGNQQVQYFDEIVSKRHQNYLAFAKAVGKNKDFFTYKLDHMSTVSNFAMPLICRDKAKAQKYKQRFTDAKVEIRPVIAGNMTKQPFYQKYNRDVEACPASDIVHANGFYFGNNAEMNPGEIQTLVKLLEKL